MDNEIQGKAVPEGVATAGKEPPEMSMPLILPSVGANYGDLLPSGKCKIFPIRGEQEELMAGAGDGVEASPVLRLVVEQLSDIGKLPYDELLTSDWIYLLLNILAFSYDPFLTFSPVCLDHNRRIPASINIEKMECVRIKPKDVENWKEPFDTDKLPWSKDMVKWRLLRVADLEKVENYVSQIQDASMGKKKPGYIYTMARHVVAVNGTALKTIDAMTWVRKAYGKDLRALQENFNAKETGYNLRPQFKCPVGPHWFRARLPLDGRFFRGQHPDNRDVA